MSDEWNASMNLILLRAKTEAFRESAEFIRGQTNGARWDYVLNAIAKRLDDKADALDGSVTDHSYAYVILKSCGCVSVAMTPEYIERWNVPNTPTLKPVTLAEYNRLKMKCDSCYKKEDELTVDRS